jgi:putative Holliday junction resolvase
MARIIAIDYGTKRCGLAISDPLGMIANGLETIEAPLLMKSLEALYQSHAFDTIVIGLPIELSGGLSAIESQIQTAIVRIKERFPSVRIERMDERFTSKMALDAMIVAGASKKQRKVKGNIDKISATLILQDYLNTRKV